MLLRMRVVLTLIAGRWQCSAQAACPGSLNITTSSAANNVCKHASAMHLMWMLPQSASICSMACWLLSLGLLQAVLFRLFQEVWRCDHTVSLAGSLRFALAFRQEDAPCRMLCLQESDIKLPPVCLSMSWPCAAMRWWWAASMGPRTAGSGGWARCCPPLSRSSTRSRAACARPS